MWNLAPPPGFQGIREDLSLELYTRNLPHWRQCGATYFVTYRLIDSLPQNKLHELEGLRREWERRQAAPRSKAAWEELTRIMSEKIERWLDQGFGSCLLRNPSAANHVAGSMHYFDGDRYELNAFVVMPNHVHLIIRPTKWNQYPLEDILKSWKQYSTNRINREMGQHGSLWQQESYDRIIRDEEHLFRCLHYIGRNPEKAGLSADDCLLWVRPEWAACGWEFRRP